MSTCPACGEEIQASARFCASCGARLEAPADPAREERRVVSVIFVDLIGFTARAERLDPEDVRAILRPYYQRVRTEIESFGGTVEKFIGDAVMAVFGAPLAYGDDPERAVRAALSVRDAVEELNGASPELDLRVRIAVNTGEALVSLGARPDAGEAMVAGDVVNTASRMQQAAPENGVLVGEETYLCTRQAVRYQALPPFCAKGKVDAVPVWAAVAVEAPVGERTLSDVPIVGRARELSALRGVWDRVANEQTPYLVTVLGPPGVGKTRLAAEFGTTVIGLGGRTVRGRCLPYRESSPYGGLAGQIKQLAGIFDNDSREVALSKLRETITGLLPAPDVAEAVDHLAILIGLAVDDVSPDRESLFFSVRCFIEAVARDRPTMLVFEDVHWADESLLDLIELLATRLRGLPLLLLTIARPELLTARPGWGGGIVAHSALPLEPLGELEAQELATRLLTSDGASRRERAAQLAELAEGNPLFIEELARAVGDASARIDGRLPTSIRGIVAARLDALPQPERAILLDASVVGRVFWRGALAPGDSDRKLLASLEARDLVRREAVSAIQGEEQFIFKHVLIRDVAYDLLPREARRERHERVARFLERSRPDVGDQAILARHWREAGDPARAVACFAEAAELAGRGWAKERAVQFYREALALLGDDDDELRRDLRMRQAVALQALMHVEDARLLKGAEELEG
jgi:class 3 adenylate cyclase